MAAATSNPTQTTKTKKTVLTSSKDVARARARESVLLRHIGTHQLRHKMEMIEISLQVITESKNESIRTITKTLNIEKDGRNVVGYEST
jgi:hypothetical protein